MTKRRVSLRLSSNIVCNNFFLALIIEKMEDSWGVLGLQGTTEDFWATHYLGNDAKTLALLESTEVPREIFASRQGKCDYDDIFVFLFS